MFDLAFVVRTEEGLTKMQAILGGLRDRYDRVAITDKGALYNTDLMETVELGYLLDCAEALVGSALRPHREPRRPLPRGPSAPRRRELAEALARLPQGRRDDPAGVQAREDGPLHPDGEEVLMATRGRGAQRLRRPADRREAGHDGAHRARAPVQPRGLAGLVVGRVDRARGPARPARRGAARDQVAPRRHPELPPVVRARHLRLGRDADQRPEPARVQGARGGRRPEGHDRADPRPGGAEGPDRRHGSVHGRLQVGAALPDQRLGRARQGAPAVTGGPRTATTTRPSASCAPAARPRARCSGATAATSAPPRS